MKDSLKAKMAVVRQLKQAIRHPYAWPGGYDIFAYTEDGAILCSNCLKENYRLIVCEIYVGCSTGWKVCGFECAGNIDCGDGYEQYCDHCRAIVNE